MQWTLPSFALAQPIQWNALLLFGSLLLFGLIAGHIVSKSPWVPRITGYLIVGFILGGGGLNWLSGDVLSVTNIFADIAVALVVYQLGRYVDIGWLRREKWLLATVVTSAVLCFTFVSLALLWFGTSNVLALLGGVWAIATAPAVVLVVLRDLKAEGQVTRRLATMTALNNFVAILAAYALLPVIAHESGTPLLTLVEHTAYSLIGSLVLAYLTYWLMMPLARLLGRQGSRQFVLVISVIALAIGVAHALHLPVMLTMLIFAIMSKNLDRQYDLMELEFGVANELFVVMLFVTVGASMRLADLSMVGLSVLILIAARFVAMGCGVFLFARFARMNWKQAGLLTLGTLPMTEAGLGLMQTISNLYPHTTSDVVPLLAGCLIVLELFGPVATQFALIKSGESGRE
ncbi:MULTISPECIES: cation:proton antiporter [unclassified Herbaspirillum]|uniref:cation:proton antiporter n=1 Tax=unclassified Herbaspirillum TaxID=2624150 RepID=UPI000E2F76E9|nr:MULTISPECIES: cation:proton antiporter [unclassified Herbaspirillum]RFB65781.1 cation:proton antiporter [Herbaspirillum sp. 3R-3a1]TFI08913.1 cation:proton antiporter [Herbaspirillum sp. 3R11]TFI15331.1 cation:proton antiporter [Herbaspirillum sp. 3R-11]TFI19968.1 cation:proton antiporter [Herbaspirillum sp. 3C11]